MGTEQITNLVNTNKKQSQLIKSYHQVLQVKEAEIKKYASCLEKAKQINQQLSDTIKDLQYQNDYLRGGIDANKSN